MGWLKNNFKVDKWTEILFDNDKIEVEFEGNKEIIERKAISNITSHLDF